MTLSFQYTPEDWEQAYRTYAFRGRRRWLTRFYIVLGCFFLLMALLVAIAPGNSFSNSVPLIFLGVLWIYLGTAMWKRAGLRSFSGRPELRQEYSVSVDETGVRFAGPISSSNWTWPAFVGFLKGKTTLLLMLSPCAFAIFPKRVFGPGQIDQFRELVRQRVAAK